MTYDNWKTRSPDDERDRWYEDYDGIPPEDDDDDYVWSEALGRWVVEDYPGDIDEAALERAEERRRKRIEWETYHPGEPCPKSELED